MARIGVLALQGDFARHAQAFRDVGATALEVRHAAALDGLDGLVLPGGESTALLKLMEGEPWFEALVAFAARGGALFGTCAGAILLSSEVLEPAQLSLGLLDATIRRNAFGRQIDSFETTLDLAGTGRTIAGVFIRAPRFVRLGPGVEVLSRFEGEPVLVRQRRVLAATFHPELTEDRRLQALFVGMASGDDRVAGRTTGDDTARPPAPHPVNQERRITC